MNRWRWIGNYLWKIKGMFVASTFLEMLSVFAAIAIIGIQKIVIDDIFMLQKYELFWPVMIWLAAAILTYFIAHAVAFLIMSRNLADLKTYMYGDLLNYYFAMPFSEYQQQRIGNMYNYFIHQANGTTNFLANRVMMGIVSIAKAIALIVLIGFSNWIVLAIIVAAACLYIWFGKYYTPRKKALAHEINSLKGDVNVLIEEGISSTREVVAYHRSEWEMKRLKSFFSKHLSKVMQEGKLANKELLSVEPLKWGVDLCVLGFAGYQVIQGSLSIGMLVVLYQLSSQLMGALHETYSFISGSAGPFANVEKLMDLMNGNRHTAGVRKLTGPVSEIRFDKVSFRYQEDTNTVFEQLSLELPIGRKIAFVGFSGAGKSTVVQLLARFYQPQSGHIYINNIELQELNRDSWMDRLAIVFQEPYLFPDTVKNNLLLGNDKVTDEELVRACRAADFYDQLMQLPDGFDTKVGERGLQLSGGQRQRLAIARALLRKPEILILDEATSALDLETERIVFRHLDHDYPDITKIIIAHRLSTIENADHIYVLQNGSIAEQGSHEQLLERNSLYKSLVTKHAEAEAVS